ncbi:3-hydroxyacyl-CoA dehydrogenase [Neptunomonas japonica]|uniref:3-hydroxyacyl-CoA dehydrogenase/3-hydroxy-2-methylbutyryl-CoA dehydrogenase n=1 Tax=Neptunomonas japonica JAMM 1380 TaxID=1441457 RepID=A0A7R6PE20_9GAMM|nr:3-hydroxyacyl-CoA dehydrogenase [Neptunomonas japonica]BBB30774.1 3-hydroxyacyl-CoA dehydrogenase/3-hydroxy-2-methylbutyryl-CoA dehydrogenase [Neptunomonas japonica JAMM 1380]
MDVDNKVAVVSGGASGLGLATSLRLIEQGAKVAVLDLNSESGEALQKEYPQQVAFYRADVTQDETIEGALSDVVTRWGKIDICVNCAGIVSAGKVLNREGKAQPLSRFSQAIQVNLIGVFNVLRVAAEKMALNSPDTDGQRGVIINTASVAAFDGQTGQAAYSASKAGIVGMTLPLARDLADIGIRVMTIAPGLFDTPMMKSLPQEVREPLINMVQSPSRFGEPNEFASLCCHIIENNYLNGEVIRLDAAIRMEPR